MRGKILSFSGEWGSGLGRLLIERTDDSGAGVVETVFCENAPTVRALEEFVPELVQGHLVRNDKLTGTRVWYEMQGGLLLAIGPDEDGGAT
jgi:hypothetical protein